MTSEGVRELIVIGGGPAGFTAALYAARANLRPLVIEFGKFFLSDGSDLGYVLHCLARETG